MPVNVLMPQMGESITEGTIVRWFKNEGEEVAKDEPLLEISTDKVDAEVPAPASGKLAKIVHGPGATVPVETVIGVIAHSGEATDVAPAPTAEAPTLPPAAPRPAAAPPPAPPVRQPAAPVKVTTPGDEESELLRRRSSPLVRRIAAEHAVDLAAVAGTGLHGRVTKEDILAFVEAGKPARPAAALRPAARAATGTLGAFRDRGDARPLRAVHRGRAARADVGDAAEDRRAHGALA
jgi:pyruvate dehydrogenase E2 component (dihydrolipoamide acetyltransferase)